MTKKNNYDYMNEFNTDGDEELDAPEKKTSDDFGSLFNESLKGQEKKLRVGDKIRGKILNLGSEEVFVTTGTRHDGVLSRRELLDAEGNCPYQVGDITEVFVTMVKGDQIRLSKNPTDRNMAEDLKGAYENNQPIQGRIVEVCKGGVRVNIKGKIAFCPISQIDSKHVENAEEYVGKSFEFKITEISEGGKNIVVSRRKLLDAEREIGTTSFLSETKDGDIATGRVTRFEPFGAFVELAPGVDGLVHISEIAWSRLDSPSDVLKLGETVTVKVLKREVLNGRAKISLSIKQATERPVREIEAPKDAAPKKDDPWAKLSAGQVFQGKVNRKEPYGLFVQLEPGITGLLHKTRTENNKDFHFEKVRVNDTVSVQIVEIRMNERQISLGLPGDSSEDNWKTEYKADANASLGSLGSKFAAIQLTKKK
jgi:small subunit ribosomal protein S1